MGLSWIHAWPVILGPGLLGPGASAQDPDQRPGIPGLEGSASDSIEAVDPWKRGTVALFGSRDLYESHGEAWLEESLGARPDGDGGPLRLRLLPRDGEIPTETPEGSAFVLPDHPFLTNDRSDLARLEYVDLFHFDSDGLRRPTRAWVDGLYPLGEASFLHRILWQRHLRGVPVLAVGSDVAALSGACLLDPEDRRDPLRNPRKLGEPQLCWGLSFFPWAFVTTEVDSPESLADLIFGAREGRMRLAMDVTRDTALFVDVKEKHATVRGPGHLWVVDLRSARRSPDRLLDGRISVLLDGDRWNQELRQLESPHLELGPGPVTSSGEAQRLRVADVWDRDAVAAAILQLTSVEDAGQVPDSVLLVDGRNSLHLERDEDTRIGAGRRGGLPTVERLRFDYEERP